MLKILIKKTAIIPVLILGIVSFCFGLDDFRNTWDYGELKQEFPRENTDVKKIECDWSTDLWNCTSVKEDKKGWNNTIIRRLLWVFGLDDSKERDLKFIDYARAILNIALWLVAFIALIVTIYTFYMMFFSENEAWIKKAKWSLFGIFIALAIIWLAWLIVSFIFRWYESNWKAREDDIEKGNVAIFTNISNNQIYLTV